MTSQMLEPLDPDEIVEVWCLECDRPATAIDGLCDPCRAGVPTAIRDPWLIAQWIRTVRR